MLKAGRSSNVKCALSSDGQSLREHFRQARPNHFRLRVFDRISQANELDQPVHRVDDRVRRAWIAVARLTDRAGIDEILRSWLELELSFAGGGRNDAVECLRRELERHRIVRMAEEAQ